jgi:hypothetical protein
VSLPTFQTIPAGTYMFRFMILKKLQRIFRGQMDMASQSKMKNCHFDIVCCMLKRLIHTGGEMCVVHGSLLDMGWYI